MRKLACLGWYGHGNFGDELILEGLRQLFKNWQIQPFSSDDTGAYPMIDFDEVNHSDLFVLGGGELIGPKYLWMPAPSRFKPHSKLYRIYAHTPFARRSWIEHVKIPKIILGCGVNAGSGYELAPNVIQDLEQFSYIGVRDLGALYILKSFPELEDKTELFFDLAFAINISASTLSYLTRVFPIKLHGFILSYMNGSRYMLPPYHRKVKRVSDTISGLTSEEIRQRQRAIFERIMMELELFD